MSTHSRGEIPSSARLGEASHALHNKQAPQDSSPKGLATNAPIELAGFLFKGGLDWSPTAYDILTRPTPVALGRGLFPGDHSFIVGVSVSKGD